MTQEVLLTISGLHSLDEMDGGDGNEPIEVITPANYYWKNGKHYILFDEVMEGIPGVTKNKIKIVGDASMEIMKSGVTNTHMVFEKSKTNVTFYETPYGQIHVGIHTRNIDVDVEENSIDVNVEYGLDVNHEALADCKIIMNIQPKGAAERILWGNAE